MYACIWISKINQVTEWVACVPLGENLVRKFYIYITDIWCGFIYGSDDYWL